MITSVQNSGVKETVKLRDRRQRDRSGLTLVEGYRELRQAITHGVRARVVYYCREYFLGDNEDALLKLARDSGAQLIATDTRVFDKLSYRDRPDGLLAVTPKIGVPLADLVLPDNPFLLIAEGLEKPGNLGTILRSADGAGVDAVVVCDRTTDLNNPNVVRASVGTLFTMPVAESATAETLSWLRDRGVRTLAATPAAELCYWDADLRGPLALVVGSEQYGLTDTWLEAADICVRIPQQGAADSLNVATASTILLYEALRQRQQ